MGLMRARSYKEVGYLAGIALVSLILAPPCMNIANILLSIDILFWLPFWIYIALLILTGPVLPHLPGFVYGIYTKGWTPRRKKKHLSTSLNYLLAFLISALLSVFMFTYVFGRVCALVSPHKPYPVWYVDVAIVAATLLVPTFHAYFGYKKHGEIREVVLLVLIYAPWVQFVRLFAVYTRFM